MRVADFPRPKGDNRRGIHWSASVYHPAGGALDFWINELQAMNIKWVKLLDDGGGSSLELCRRLLAADIMPIVRLYRLEPNPGTVGGRELETVRRLVDLGVRYFETNNEPDLPAEWKGGRMPPNWLDVVIDNFIYDADKLIELGALPALPAMGVGSRDNPVALVVQRGRSDLFEKGAWLAIHNYTLNHPLDYPYDPVNQEGQPVSKEEYDRLGPWAWEGRPRELINEWRAQDKNPGDTIDDDPTCFLAFDLADRMVRQALGFPVPIISTEGGVVVGWKDDRRYPRVDPHTHAEWTVAINDFMQGGREIHGLRCPDNYFAMCHWLIANYRLGFLAPGWESQSWYSDWWNNDFNLRGELPVVAAVKAMPNRPVDQARSATLSGRLVRADTGEPLPDLTVTLLSADREVAATRTAADGAFQFTRLLPGRYDLAVAPWGVVRRDVPAAVEPGPPLTVLLSGGRSSVLRGLVADASGAGLAGTTVILRRGRSMISEVTTGADGAFRFEGLPMGVYSLSVPGITVAGIALDGWASKNLKLTAGKPAGFRYVVTSSRLLSAAETAGRRIFYGTVLDANGVPRNGVKVRMSWEGAAPGTDFPITTTGRDPFKPVGYYEFIHTPGVFMLQVVEGDWPSDVATGLDTANVPGRAGQAVTYEVNFRLQAIGGPARIDGLIPGGRTGSRLQLTGGPTPRETVLAADGSFAFDDLPPATYRLELAGVGVIADEIALQQGALFKLLFPLRGKVQGQVLAVPAGTLAVLYAPSEWGWTRQALVEADGSFVFENLPPGRYSIQVADHLLTDIEVTGESTIRLAPIDLAAGRRSVVRGRVADAAGRPRQGVTMILRRDGLLVAQTQTGADGIYRFANLPAGIYALEAVGLGQVAGGITLDGEREQVSDVLWPDVRPRGVVQGRVLSAAGQPQAGRTVRLLRDAVELARTQSDAGGAFRFTELAAGIYALAVGEAAALVNDVQLAEDATVARDLILPEEPKSLLAHYFLFAGPEQAGAEARLALALIARYLRRIGATGGFSAAEAAKARKVTIVGDVVAAGVEAELRAAGCQVERLAGDGYALAEALERLLSELGEG